MALAPDEAELDEHMRHWSYVVGYTPSALDAAVFDAMPAEPAASHVHARRWYQHLASLSEWRRASLPPVAEGVSIPPVATVRVKFRVLCCHGYAQGATVFLEKRARELRNSPVTRPLLDLAAVDGPSNVAALGVKHRCWWEYDPPFPLHDRTLQPPWWAQAEVEYVGADTGLEFLVEEWRRGSYDAILGFSQAAIWAVTWCNLIRY